MKRLFCLVATILICASVFGQHCPYDFSAAIIVHIHEKDSSKTIPNLRLTLIDSSGKALTATYYRNKQFVNDTVRFWQNPAQTTFKGYIDNENPAEDEKIRFPFAADHYVLVISRGMDLTGYSIRIENGKSKNQYQLPYYDVSLSNNDKYILCGTYDEKDYRVKTYGDREYKPVDITLTRKK
jgi:hypothetical protein